MLIDLPASLAEIDARIDHARHARDELLLKGHLRMAEIASNQLDTLLDIRWAVMLEGMLEAS